jgi:DNA-binding NtrC family response regulator
VILLVEDDQAVRGLASQVLVKSGFHVLEAGDPGSAIALAEANPIDLLLTDVILPNMDGPQLAAAVKVCRPDLRVIYMSGYTGDAALGDDSTISGEFLQKPFLPDELLRMVRRALAPA